MQDEKIVVLIPAYKPAHSMVSLCQALCEAGLTVLVVDDGSGEAYRSVFEAVDALGCHVERHAVNLGKGRALKSGINVALNRYQDLRCLVTADADGQHTCNDILRIIEAMRAHPGALVTGSRKFTGDVPLKSRIGNLITRYVYRFVTGIHCHDTQTGLRGIPADALGGMLRITGERYEYEMNMLLKLRDMRMPLHEEEIETIYIDDNKGSHFHPLRDAARVYGVIFRFALSSLLAFGIDYSFYLLFLRVILFTPALSYACARVISSLFNYAVNHVAVFGRHGGKSSVIRYYLLAAVQLLVGAGLVELLYTVLGFRAAWMKIPVDLVLFFVSFWMQREFVFVSRKQKKEGIETK